MRDRRAFAIIWGLAALAAFGCSESRSVRQDGGLQDQGSSADSSGDLAQQDGTAQADLAPDQARVPAHWEVIEGMPLLVDHTATLLDDGRVLFVGGASYDNGTENYLEEAYLYLPDERRFVSGGRPAYPRYYHTANLLPDGRVMVIGGEGSEDYLDSVEIFDPSAPIESAWSEGEPLPYSRWGHTTVALPDGRVMVFGGFGYSDSTDSIFLLNQGLWLTRTMNEPRRFHSTTLMQNGKVLVAGGYAGKNIYEAVDSDTVEICDPVGGGCELLEQTMDMPRIVPESLLLPGGEVLILGGWTTQFTGDAVTLNNLYDPQTEVLSEVENPYGGQMSPLTAAVLLDGRAMVISRTDKAERALAYDRQQGWSALPDLPEPRVYHTMTTLKDGSVLVAGGYISSDPDNLVYATTALLFVP